MYERLIELSFEEKKNNDFIPADKPSENDATRNNTLTPIEPPNERELNLCGRVVYVHILSYISVLLTSIVLSVLLVESIIWNNRQVTIVLAALTVCFIALTFGTLLYSIQSSIPIKN